jgi:hypothetical protein
MVLVAVLVGALGALGGRAAASGAAPYARGRAAAPRAGRPRRGKATASGTESAGEGESRRGATTSSPPASDSANGRLAWEETTKEKKLGSLL